MTMTLPGFSIAREVLDLGVIGACVVMREVRNAANSAAFAEMREAVLQEVGRDLSRERIKADPILAGYRQLHDAIGRSNRRNVAAPEALLTMLLETGRFPRVNLLVDLYNLLSLRTGLSLGAHDLTNITGRVCLRLADGSEQFQPMGAADTRPLQSGDYAYIDDAHDVLCRLEVRQGEKTKVELTTTACLYIIQGNPATSRELVLATMDELIRLTHHFCGGDAEVLYRPA